jgi:hypothetical protein
VKKKSEKMEEEWREDREARGRGDSVSQPRLPLLLSRQGTAESLCPPVVIHLLGRLGVENL